MLEIDAVIDNKPTKALVKELAELRIRNLLCFRELEALNENGKFLYKHPLIRNYSERVKLETMFREDPDRFLDEFGNTRENVKRYTSFLKNKKRSPEQKEKDRQNLDKHKDRKQLFIDITKQNNGN
ncbi:hypothetical protein [uncultured Draconibacterium sp.]|uniref:hypothetical protein n=1 Tax=uncultured Draconibacterium sp. TaxID=1573823 RepID=UPI0029C6CDE1|nr:hypothetical protein [uncultured Draconibacterium sp.]